jgi:hypothetical protein
MGWFTINPYPLLWLLAQNQPRPCLPKLHKKLLPCPQFHMLMLWGASFIPLFQLDLILHLLWIIQPNSWFIYSLFIGLLSNLFFITFKVRPHMAYCIVVRMPTLNLKVREMPMGLVMSKLVGPSSTLLLLLEVLLFLSSPKNKKLVFFLPLKLKTLLAFQLLRSVFGYVSSLQI